MALDVDKIEHQHTIHFIMADQDKKLVGANNKKKKLYGQYTKGMVAGRTMHKCKVAGLEDDTFDAEQPVTPPSLASH